jgi:hypothetical protein
VVSGRDNAFNGQAPERQRVDQISNDVYGPTTLESYLNRAAFTQPAPGTFGITSASASKARDSGKSTWP